VVLAIGFEADVAQHHDLVVALHLFEGALQDLGRVVLVAGKELLVGAHDAVRCAEQALAIGIVARPAQQDADRFLRLLARRACYGAQRRHLAPF